MFTKARYEFSRESVCVYLRRSRDKRGNDTRVIYKNIKKTAFVCYISNAIPGFVRNNGAFTKVRYEFSRESFRVYLRRSRDKRGNITRIIKKQKLEINFFVTSFTQFQDLYENSMFLQR